MIRGVRGGLAPLINQFSVVIENDQTRRLFPGHPSDLALELVYGLRLAAIRAGVRKKVHPRVFRRMKLRAFQEAGVREDVIASAMGFGRPWPRRRVDETLEEAEVVLGVEEGLLGRLVKKIERWLG
jgi:hypothetical protein